MNILIIDATGSALDWALRCQDYGHKVRWYIDKQKDGKNNGLAKVESKIGRNMVPRIRDWNKEDMDWADLIFLTDNTKHLKELDSYFRKGYPIFGPNYEASQLELDRQLGQDTFKKAGIKIMPSVSFSDYGKAEKFVLSTMKRYVSKPNGDADKALSYCSKNPADMIYMLRRWEKNGKGKREFILQEFVPGIEMAVGGWFGPNGFYKYVNENWEFKKLMNGDLGVATGEQGTIMRYTRDSKLADEILYPLEDILHKINYIGYVDINCIIDGKGNPRPLEWTCRPGWPHFQIAQSLHEGDPAEWMLDKINGKDSLQVSEDIACGVVLSMPDYPYSTLTKKDVTGVPIYGITDKNMDNIHPAEVMLDMAPCMEGDKVKDKMMWVTAGDYVLITTGTGSTIKEAKESSYKVMKEIEMPNSIMYRTDIGDRLEEQLPELRKMGFCTDIRFK